MIIKLDKLEEKHSALAKKVNELIDYINKDTKRFKEQQKRMDEMFKMREKKQVADMFKKIKET